MKTDLEIRREIEALKLFKQDQLEKLTNLKKHLSDRHRNLIVSTCRMIQCSIEALESVIKNERN